MKVEYIDGCTLTGVYIDGEPLVDLPKEKQKEVLIKVLGNLDNPTYSIQEFLIAATQEEGEYEDLGKCETCGDYIYKNTIICK